MNKKKNNQPTYVFIDASNIIYGCNSKKWKMDFKKLFKYLKERFNAEKVFYFAGLDPENKKQLGFYEKLQEFGYILRLVPLKTFSDGSRKGDVDSRMTFEIMRQYENFDKTVVLTGDGDYFWVLEYLIENDKKVRILSFPNRTAQELKKLVKGNFASLTSLKSILEFKK